MLWLNIYSAINTVNSSNGSSGSTSSPEWDSKVLFLYYCMFAVLFHALLIVLLKCTFQKVNQRYLQRIPWQSPHKNLLKHWCIRVRQPTASSTCTKHQNARSAKKAQLITKVNFNYKIIAKIIQRLNFHLQAHVSSSNSSGFSNLHVTKGSSST